MFEYYAENILLANWWNDAVFLDVFELVKWWFGCTTNILLLFILVIEAYC